MDNPTQTYKRVMAITHAEFLRSLIPLKKHYSYKFNPSKTSISIAAGSGELTIQLGPEYVKRLGALEMPFTDVEFAFTGFTPSDLNEFWRLFDLCFRRGGG